MRAYRRSGGEALFTLNLGTKWGWVVTVMHQLLEAHRTRSIHWTGSRVVRGVRLDALEKQNIPFSHQESKYGPLGAQPVAVSLQWLSYMTSGCGYMYCWATNSYFHLPLCAVCTWGDTYTLLVWDIVDQNMMKMTKYFLIRKVNVKSLGRHTWKCRKSSMCF
jgi:hypothetical protein